MTKKKTSIKLSENTIQEIEVIKGRYHLNTNTAAIEQAVHVYATQEDILKELALMKKYLNEIRRNNYLELGLLNAITITLNVPTAMPHQDPKYQSMALISAHENLSIYLNEIATKNKDRQLGRGEL